MGGKDVGEMNERELSEFFDKTNCTIASNGVMYKNDKKGLIPTLLVRWFDTRKEYRQLVKNMQMKIIKRSMTSLIDDNTFKRLY